MLFSILMCTMNSAETLHSAIDSVRNQSYADWELIILDNGSKDRTPEILREYQEQDKRISCSFRDSNIGWPKGISICLAQARGEYMMFLGADDYLAGKETLQEVSGEIVRHQPDIVWTGWEYAVFENGIYKSVQKKCPSYRVFYAEDKMTELVEVMREVYYNSVMHYVNINFLKRYGIDFYQPFYGDCMGMTEALCKAKRMVVMDKIEYVLTINTSQTSSKTGFDYDIARQWRSIKETFPDLRNAPEEKVCYIAERIFRNLVSMYEGIVLGGMLRNRWMNPVEATLPERFLKAEEWLSSDAFGEMMYYSNRRVYEEKLIGAAGVLFWTCMKQEKSAAKIRKYSKWLAGFAEAAFVCDAQGAVQWKQKLVLADVPILLAALNNEANLHRIGAELLLREDIECEDSSFQRSVQAILEAYMQKMKKG